MKKIIIIIVSLFVLTGCVDNSNKTNISTKSYTPYSILNNENKTLWFEFEPWRLNDEEAQVIGKDSYMDSMFILEDGNITYYNFSDYGKNFHKTRSIKMSDLKDLNDDEIIKLANEKMTSYINEIIDYLEESFYEDFDGNNAYFDNILLKSESELNSLVEKLNIYKEQFMQPSKAKLKIYTDSTGNVESNECIVFNKNEFSFDNELLKTQEEEVCFTSGSNTYQIYDKFYEGYYKGNNQGYLESQYVTRVEDEGVMFKLDKPNTNNIETD